MLAIRMQRTGRKGYASFRVVVQDSRFAPTSGRVVAKIGHHNPHTKETVINKDLAEQYLSNGAQPTPRVVRLFKLEKVKMPSWVEESADSKKRFIKNPEKLRKNQPKEEAATDEAASVEDEKAEENTSGDVPQAEDSSTDDASTNKEQATEDATEEPKDS